MFSSSSFSSAFTFNILSHLTHRIKFGRKQHFNLKGSQIIYLMLIWSLGLGITSSIHHLSLLKLLVHHLGLDLLLVHLHLLSNSEDTGKVEDSWFLSKVLKKYRKENLNALELGPLQSIELLMASKIVLVNNLNRFLVSTLAYWRQWGVRNWFWLCF